MEEKTFCIILRLIPYREKSLIVNTFTKDHGRIDLMLKGGRSVTAKHYPSAGLFRVFFLSFALKDGKNPSSSSSSDIFNPREMEYITSFDSIARHTENYLLLCDFASFLLKHTAPFLVLPRTYEALFLLLKRATEKEECSFEANCAKLVFLEESGLLPENAGKSRENHLLLQEILAYALQENREKPPITPQYEKRLGEWVKALCRYHGLL